MKRFNDTELAVYDLTEIPSTCAFINAPEAISARDAGGPPLPEGIKWGSEKKPPAISERVTIRFNQLGSGVVESYFIEHNWLGVCVLLDNPPQWKRDQQKTNWDVALVFAPELVEFGPAKA